MATLWSWFIIGQQLKWGSFYILRQYKSSLAIPTWKAHMPKVTHSAWAEIWMKARTNTGKRGAKKHVTVCALTFLFYRINTADSFSALALLWDRSLIYWQPGLPAVFLDQSRKHQSGSKVQPSKTSSHSGVCSTRKEWGESLWSAPEFIWSREQ